MECKEKRLKYVEEKLVSAKKNLAACEKEKR